ncbi:hypothetical protein AB0M25_06425 [Streptomyces griseomycini]|uniref:hypothetical protein n=1 Tax=Streptomyces griseomycini TaxID=66895 RepID=UPI0034400C88
MPADASATDAKTVAVPLPGVATQRPARRGDGWRLRLAALVGRGSTQAAAKRHLAEQIALMAETIAVEPAFARDDDGDLIVALDRPWGIEWYRATDTHARRISTGDRHAEGPAADLARVDHYTLLPAYTSGRTDGAPRPPLFTMAEIEKALNTAHDRAHAHTADTAALDIFRGAVKTLLTNPASEYPIPDDKAAAEA